MKKREIKINQKKILQWFLINDFVVVEIMGGLAWNIYFERVPRPKTFFSVSQAVAHQLSSTPEQSTGIIIHCIIPFILTAQFLVYTNWCKVFLRCRKRIEKNISWSSTTTTKLRRLQLFIVYHWSSSDVSYNWIE